MMSKELSWLSFNARVLQEAEDPQVPLIERVRFMGIFSNNLDEFYRVRYADVRRLAVFSRGSEKASYEKLLDDIRDAVGDLQLRFDRVYRTSLAELRKYNIYLIDETQLQPHQREFVTKYFFSRVLPELSPLLISESAAVPQLDDGSIYLADFYEQYIAHGQHYQSQIDPSTGRIYRLRGARSRDRSCALQLQHGRHAGEPGRGPSVRRAARGP